MKIKLILLLFYFYSINLFAGKVTILVAYYTQSGNTGAMAEAVADGAAINDSIDIILKKVDDVKQEELLRADAIILGSPVYNGNVAPAVLAFINHWPFKGQPMKDKIGAAFCSGGGISAGEEAVQMSILRAMLVFNMIVIGGPDWQIAFGASAVTGEGYYDSNNGKVDNLFLQKAKALGRRVAELTLKMRINKTTD